MSHAIFGFPIPLKDLSMLNWYFFCSQRKISRGDYESAPHGDPHNSGTGRWSLAPWPVNALYFYHC